MEDDASGELTTVGDDGTRAGDEAQTVGALPRGAASSAVQPESAAATLVTAAPSPPATSATTAQQLSLPLASPSPPLASPPPPPPPPPPAQRPAPPPSSPDTRMLHPGPLPVSRTPSNASSATVAWVADSCTPGSSSSCTNPDTTALPVGQSTPTPQLPPAAALRKTSPGLAARLKALGFGSSPSSSTTISTTKASPESSGVGRLDQHHLRQLDEKHQAASFASIITRRGRPWKGNSNRAPGSRVVAEADSWGPFAADMDPGKPTLGQANGNGAAAQHPPSPADADSTPRKETIALPLTPPIAAGDEDSPDGDDYVAELSSYFSPSRNRPGSIYTLSRASFASQLAQLTSLQLPDAQSLSSKVSGIRTAQVAAKALMNAAEQIQSWISKAQEVVGGLDSDDDVEWAAAGGREGLHEVESAISRFEHVIKAYVGSIEELQSRPDIASVPVPDLQEAVGQMEAITNAWATIRTALQSVGSQVETAMEWEELWNSVLGDIQDEMEELSRLVFEMEERRHQAAAAAAEADGATPDAVPSRLSTLTVPASPGSPDGSSQGLSADDSSLLALFARMQPLRASLDFLPMRLHAFTTRASAVFPTACEELSMRHAGLDGRYAKLDGDAAALRKELGEDRWVVVFRGAGRQAQRMQQSVQRTLARLSEALDAGEQLSRPRAMQAKKDSYEAKKRHYGPAIERVLGIIAGGVQDRLTVNGEVLRLHTHLQLAWLALRRQMAHMDALLHHLERHWERPAPEADALSSLASNPAASPGTPGSSPPSSTLPPRPRFAPSSSSSSSFTTPRPTTSSPSTTPAPTSRSTPPRPRWNPSTNTSSLDTGHFFSPPSRLPIRASTATPQPRATPPRLASSFASHLASPPSTPRSLSRPRLAPKASMSALSAPRRTSMQPHLLDVPLLPARQPTRPATAMATSRRTTSFAPPPQSGALRNRPLEPKDVKPRWRH
ncbi:hypothetical protein CDD81_4318 [Ophiocordyceps australis]|uniref:Karyogamy protein n=1 Tax=Ophiocordyceps australis TaxID=1399860 RepID=A0A2C5XAG4_9HYPO|nr:hypothetical protein CDD81_4318 [Ophiocordyceps australis]